MTISLGSIAKAGVRVIVSNSNFGDVAMHFIEKYGILALKLQSKFEMRRLGAAVGARTLARLDTPSLEDIGHCDHVDVQDVGSKLITVFAQGTHTSKLSTIIVRGATHNMMDDVERAIDNGINVFKVLTKDARLVGGGGAVEMELHKDLLTFAEAHPGLDQYAMRRFATGFDVIARSLAEVSGYNSTDVITQIEADHQSGKANHGIRIEDGSTMDTVHAHIVDPLLLKHWGIKLATEAAVTVLQVDQIIVAKQAGGPKLRPDAARDNE